MRRSVIIPVALYTFVAVATLLWLLWYFIPAGNVFKGLTTLLTLFLAGWIVIKNCRRDEPESDATATAADLPLPDTPNIMAYTSPIKLSGLPSRSPAGI